MFPQVFAMKEDMTVIAGIGEIEGVQQRGLATAGGTYDQDFLAGLDVKAHLAQQKLVLVGQRV